MHLTYRYVSELALHCHQVTGQPAVVNCQTPGFGSERFLLLLVFLHVSHDLAHLLLQVRDLG